MKLRRRTGPVVATLLMFVFAVPAWSKARRKDRGDVYLGFSYVGANLYNDGSSRMKGWQAAAHFRLLPLLGVEGDFAHYSTSDSVFSEQVTTVMFGPRITAPAGALSFFAHGLTGLAHQNANLTTYPYVDYDAVSYAFGGGVDIPVFRGWKFRATADYLGNSKAPTAADLGGLAPSHLRIGAGVAYHF